MTRKEEDRESPPRVQRARRARYALMSSTLVVVAAVACGNKAQVVDTTGLSMGAGAVPGMGGTGANGGSGGSAADTGGDTMTEMGGTGAVGGGLPIDPNQGQDDKPKCPPTTCAEQGYGCGSIVDACGTVINCADEGLKCGPLEACVGGLDTPAQCMVGGGEPCELCPAVQDCSMAAQATTLTGRVVTAGRDDANLPNQLGVPNAFVYILRNKGVADLPEITSGIPKGGTSCDRCEDQDLGPVLVGTVTDATGAFKLEGNVPVGEEFTLVIKAGRFRRAVAYTLPDSAACQTTALPTTLPDNPARLPRTMKDGLAVNIPHIAVSTGSIDAMECVLLKMGIAADEFVAPGDDGLAAGRVHMYQGSKNSNATQGNGLDLATGTPLETELYGDGARLQSYDIVLADCEGQFADSSTGNTYAERDAYGDNVVEYVNRGGRMFVSHLRYTWLLGNGTQDYDAADPFATGLDAAATWDLGDRSTVASGKGVVAVGRPQASPRIQSFADWMANEKVAPAPDYKFDIVQPRSQEATLGASSEEFALTTETTRTDMMMTTTTANQTQQFSFNTPYAAPAEAVCGRVAYSGFHVSIGGSTDNTGDLFPAACTGDLTAQEKVLLYMLFDLATCVGDTPPPPVCEPQTCDDLDVKCGFTGDGCGKVVDCGPCTLPVPK